MLLAFNSYLDGGLKRIEELKLEEDKKRKMRLEEKRKKREERIKQEKRKKKAEMVFKILFCFH